MITEAGAKLDVKIPGVISKEMDVFYNPLMKFNRDIAILLLNSVGKTALKIALPLAGTGVRGIRMFFELKQFDAIAMNDLKKEAYRSMKKNLKLNRIKSGKMRVENKDANRFLLDSGYYDYIDIDPWGSPNYFLDAAIKRLADDGILAVTATDTGCLAGSFPAACIRKYWAVPKRDENMHETGLRILIRKVQLVAAQYDRAMTPIFSFARDHYLRAFFRLEKGKKRADSILKKHAIWNEAGPLWTGQLWDKGLVKEMCRNNTIPENQQFLDSMYGEAKILSVGTHNIHALARKYKIHNLPKTEALIAAIKKKSCKAAVSHFDPVAIRSNIPEKVLVRLMGKIAQHPKSKKRVKPG